ncbi:16776_t:CDS:1 [Acaulospora morrowiae]|uniref:16776_t:CDS:1 n=1 Tax=Acaulospora morrowiae TaxID=94023 RepID=A0A9N8VNN3_9GLOM|nr:16776_t:CDS:1 [Acaulospora morrowiae]
MLPKITLTSIANKLSDDDIVIITKKNGVSRYQFGIEKKVRYNDQWDDDTKQSTLSVILEPYLETPITPEKAIAKILLYFIKSKYKHFDLKRGLSDEVFMVLNHTNNHEIIIDNNRVFIKPTELHSRFQDLQHQHKTQQSLERTIYIEDINACNLQEKESKKKKIFELEQQFLQQKQRILELEKLNEEVQKSEQHLKQRIQEFEQKLTPKKMDSELEQIIKKTDKMVISKRRKYDDMPFIKNEITRIGVSSPLSQHVINIVNATEKESWEKHAATSLKKAQKSLRPGDAVLNYFRFYKAYKKICFMNGNRLNMIYQSIIEVYNKIRGEDPANDVVMTSQLLSEEKKNSKWVNDLHDILGQNLTLWNIEISKLKMPNGAQWYKAIEISKEELDKVKKIREFLLNDIYFVFT